MRALSIVLWIAISAAAMSQAPATPPPRTIPANEAFRRVMAEHLRVSGAGMVIGIMEPSGRPSSSMEQVPLAIAEHFRNTLFQIGSVTKTFTSCCWQMQ